MNDDSQTQPLFNPLIEHAIELSAQWHDRTYRKSRWRDPAFKVPEDAVLRVPVMAHVTAVAMTVQRAGWDDATVAAAFLHDVIEDVNRFGQTLRQGQLRKLLGEEVIDRVMQVTEQKLDEQGNPRGWRERKEGYVEQLLNGRREAAAISLADKLHNLWSINESLSRGVDVFESGTHRRALSAGPEQQYWFHQAVLDASRQHDDSRLEPLRVRLKEEIDRFVELTGLEERQQEEVG